MRQTYEAVNGVVCEPGVKLCDCMHDSTEHRERVGPCRGRDGYRCRCECPSFLEQANGFDDDPEDD